MSTISFKDNDYVPRQWDYDLTKRATVLKQSELKALRDELNKEYLRRWSGYCKGVSNKELYMDYQSASTQFTPNDSATNGGAHGFSAHSHGLHTYRIEIEAQGASSHQMADGNVSASYWDTHTSRDFRGCPAWYGPLDRYIDNVGNITYNITSNVAPSTGSSYVAPAEKMTFPVGTSRWQNTDQYRPHNVSNVNKDRALKHLIDGLCNIVDIDKYYGTGIQSGDPVVPVNPVSYMNDQNPQNSERIGHAWRQVGIIGDSRNGSIKDWIAILKQEKRNTYYTRACNYQRWLWYFTHFTYYAEWYESGRFSVSGGTANEGSFNRPNASGSGSQSYSQRNQKTDHKRAEYNPSYVGHRESYTSCLQACTGFCAQTCFHVCDEQCVYMCDDRCGYSCMGSDNCGTTCIAQCRDNCGGRFVEGGSGNICQNSCYSGSNSVVGACGGCHASCTGYVKDQQACNSCTGFCSTSCSNLCIQSCRFNCVGGCNISCSESCNTDAGKDFEGKAGCASSTCAEDCFDEAAPEGEEGEGEGGEEEE